MTLLEPHDCARVLVEPKHQVHVARYAARWDDQASSGRSARQLLADRIPSRGGTQRCTRSQHASNPRNSGKTDSPMRSPTGIPTLSGWRIRALGLSAQQPSTTRALPEGWMTGRLESSTESADHPPVSTHGSSGTRLWRCRHKLRMCARRPDRLIVGAAASQRRRLVLAVSPAQAIVHACGRCSTQSIIRRSCGTRSVSCAAPVRGRRRTT